MKVRLYFLTALLSIAAARGYSGGRESLVAPGVQVIKLADGFRYPTGLASNAIGNVFFSDVPNNRIHKWSLDGKLTTFCENAGGASGLSFDKNGNLLACETSGRRLVSINPQGKVEVLADKYQDKPFNHISDLWIDPKGGIYFTDHRWGKEKMEQGGPYVYYLSPDYKDIKRVIEDMVSQKALIGVPDGKILYVSDHDRDDKRGGKTFRYTINKDGTLSNKKLFAPEGPDGMTIDSRGNVYLASRNRAVAVYNKNGEKIEAIAVPESLTDVCFGGEDKRTLFITTRKSLYSVRMCVSGVEQHSLTDTRNSMLPVVSTTDVQVDSGEEGENGTSDINQKITQICTGPADFNDVIRIFGRPSGYDYGGQSFKLEDLPVERFWIRYTDSIHMFMRRDKVDGLEIVDPAYVFNGKIPMGSSLEHVLNIVGQPKETVLGERGWEDCVLYKDINGRVGWCQYRREDLNADFRFLNYTLKCVHVLEIKGSSTTAGRTSKHGSFQTVKTIESVNEFDDVRWKDMSKLDLSKRKGLVSTLKFNQKTVWPEQAKLPTSCDPDKFLKEGMNPGLGVRELHKQGIIGKGVNVAVIDQPMYLDHPEFAGKIVSYHDVGCGSKSSMHGPAVTSLLVGTNCGTAPGSRVYYVAAPSWTKDAAFQAEALFWIIEQNEKLPKEKKIRAVSVSAAPSGPGSPFNKHNKMWDRACKYAENAGILVLDCTSHHGFIGACWYDAMDPENVAKCTPGFRGRGGWGRPGCILVPTSPRTTAEEYDKGEFAYQYCGRGGLSWAIPYCTGILALGWQINQELSSVQMRDLLFKSAYINDDGMRIINPEGFIQLVKKLKVNSSTQISQ